MSNLSLINVHEQISNSQNNSKQFLSYFLVNHGITNWSMTLGKLVIKCPLKPREDL